MNSAEQAEHENIWNSGDCKARGEQHRTSAFKGYTALSSTTPDLALDQIRSALHRGPSRTGFLRARCAACLLPAT